MDTLKGVMATAAGAGFWYNFVVGVREYKPHLFKHNCKKCFKSGLMKCPKCDGFGVMERVARDTRRAMTIQRRMTDAADNGGYYDCNFCNGKGVKECTACQGQGWEILPFINYRKFQPHPVFEDYHWARGKWKAKNRDREKAIEKRALEETVEAISDGRNARLKAEKKEQKKRDKGKKRKREMLKKAKTTAVSDQFGKYGTITQEDFYRKKPEFNAWALEVKGQHVEGLNNTEQKQLFKDFVEDHNTATFPSKKYYNIDYFEKTVAAKKKHKPMASVITHFDDEKARKNEIEEIRQKRAEKSLKDEITTMQQNKSKVDQMKHQENLRQQMAMLNKTGNYAEAKKIAERMDPGKDEFGRPIRNRK